MRFERSRVFKRSRQLTVEVYKTTKKLRDFGFRDQITRSALSVPSNIAEGLERRTDKDLRHFLTVAKASCAEFKAQTMIAEDIGYINDKVAIQWQNEATEIAKMLGGFIRTLEKQ